MLAFFTTFIFSLLVYLLLTIGSGGVFGLWAPDEIQLGLICAIAAALAAFRFFPKGSSGAALKMTRWARMVMYTCGPFFVELAKANWDVSKRVLSNQYRPGIVKVKTGMTSDVALTMLANSITLTPGTLTVDVDEETNELYIHMLNVPEGMETQADIPADTLFSTCDCVGWIRRVTK